MADLDIGRGSTVGDESSLYLNCGNRAEVRSALDRFSPFQARFGEGHRLIRFDTQRVRLREALEERLAGLGHFDGSRPLERLHEALSPDLMMMDQSGQPPLAVAFYEAGNVFMAEYQRLLSEVLQDEIFAEPLYYQQTPTFRFSFPGSPGYSWRPNYHADIAIGHPPMEVNVWIPLTECLAGNGLIYAPLEESLGMWREYDYDFRRFHADLDVRDDLQARCAAMTKPLICDYGDLFLFDSRCMHLHQPNRTQQTRISVDFRVVPLSDSEGLSDGYVGTGRRRARFEPGGYYAKDTSEILR